jgi:hypothetical protein
MEALVESSDSRVSARDRIDAARVLADAGVAAEPEAAAILTRQVAALSDAALEHEVDLFLRPEVERRVAEELARRGAELDARRPWTSARRGSLRWGSPRRSEPRASGPTVHRRSSESPRRPA